MPGRPHSATHISPAGTADAILDVAERLAQTRGFNGFSYADIATELGITKASLHYHFRTKADLGARLMARYSAAFSVALNGIAAAQPPGRKRLDQYVELYSGVLRGDRMCLCGMLAAEYTTLPEPMRQEIRGFFDLNEEWLARMAEEAREAGELAFEGPAQAVGRLILGSLEGAMLVARSFSDVSRFEATAARLLDELIPARAPGQAGTR